MSSVTPLNTPFDKSTGHVMSDHGTGSSDLPGDNSKKTPCNATSSGREKHNPRWSPQLSLSMSRSLLNAENVSTDSDTDECLEKCERIGHIIIVIPI